MLGVVLATSPAAFAAFDWQAGPWGVVVSTNGTPGSTSCPVDYPGGTETGNALAVHYAFTPTNLPQLWVFLTDGFWRQTSAESEFLTSYRLFRYHSSGNQDCDRLSAVRFEVLGTNTAGELELATLYDNDSSSGDSFCVSARVVLERPDALQGAMRAEIIVSNASGRAVAPFWQGHRDLAEQWELLGLSSMYVADNLTGGLPDWYDALDPTHRYVGTTNDATYLNDGYSINGATNVATHDVKHIVASNRTVSLDHDTNLCPVVTVPGYPWYGELVMRGQVAHELRMQHAHRSARNHCVQLLGCAGLTADRSDLRWAATYNRSDTNLVDGDNVQVKLGMDDRLDAWPEDGVQALSLRLTTGNARPSITSFTLSQSGDATIGWLTEPGERYGMEHAVAMGQAWSNVVQDVAGPTLGPLPIPPGFLRIVEAGGP